MLCAFYLALCLLCTFCFVSCLCKVRSRVSDALSQPLCNLPLAFLADFTPSDSTALIRFIAFSCKIRHSAFRLDRKTWSQSSALQVQQFYTVGIPLLEAYSLPMANNRTRNERLSQEQMAASHVVQIHTHARFPRSKKWPTYHVAIPTGKALASQRSIFRVNLELHPPLRGLVPFVAQIIMLKVRCWVTDTHMNTQPHRSSTVALAAHACRGLITI